jgi:hypothetical protein
MVLARQRRRQKMRPPPGMPVSAAADRRTVANILTHVRNNWAPGAGDFARDGEARSELHTSSFQHFAIEHFEIARQARCVEQRRVRLAAFFAQGAQRAGPGERQRQVSVLRCLVISSGIPQPSKAGGHAPGIGGAANVTTGRLAHSVASGGGHCRGGVQEQVRQLMTGEMHLQLRGEHQPFGIDAPSRPPA